ncbi:hypothetical protein N656DRAFT_180483 [Canariomyces notabilis]|uniref:Transmembrane protein n=1 Tax=Canariomyces notabilis TaxID=2074819 RepID=A0AAN6QJT1_9PEZI|nr:hypothetical protein N656DRAFT_180483 [Canariomyces arenarius]
MRRRSFATCDLFREILLSRTVVVLLVSYVCTVYTLPYLASLPAHLQAELGFLLVVPFPVDQFLEWHSSVWPPPQSRKTLISTEDQGIVARSDPEQTATRTAVGSETQKPRHKQFVTDDICNPTSTPPSPACRFAAGSTFRIFSRPSRERTRPEQKI